MHRQDDFLRPVEAEVPGVTELTRRIKGLLEKGFARIWVRGEVSNLRRQSSGHVYFSLKDAGSQIPCVLFARDAVRQSFDPRDGMDLMLFGDLSVYEPHGRYQLIARVAIEAGAGRLQAEFERLKRRLAAEGLFDLARKRPLPALPRRVAVITSPTGAALRDFLRILRRRGFGGTVTLYPSRVQGAGASAELAAMLERAASDKRCDLVVLTRGGGSLEDLWPFNEEALARAVAACPLPVVSAVGHEIDTVLTDLAADVRAETPSGAAELISSLFIDARRRLDDAAERLVAGVGTTLRDQRRELRFLEGRLRAIAPARQAGNLGIRLDDASGRLRAALRERLARIREELQAHDQNLGRQSPGPRLRLERQQVSAIGHRFHQAARHQLSSRQQAITAAAQRLENGSLQSGLRRGFAILRDESGNILSRAAAVREQERITAQLRDGDVSLHVRNP